MAVSVALLPLVFSEGQLQLLAFSVMQIKFVSLGRYPHLVFVTDS